MKILNTVYNVNEIVSLKPQQGPISCGIEIRFRDGSKENVYFTFDRYGSSEEAIKKRNIALEDANRQIDNLTKRC